MTDDPFVDVMIVKKASQRPEVQSSTSSKTVALVSHGPPQPRIIRQHELQHIEPTASQVQVCALCKHTFVFDGDPGKGVVLRGSIWPYTLLIVKLGEKAGGK